mgnify:CR=1 FL=1
MNTKVDYDNPFAFTLSENKQLTMYSQTDAHYEWTARIFFCDNRWYISESIEIDYEV